MELVNTLYKEASTSVNINGQDGTIFQLQRSIRKGCPLAPYLYIFVGDVLGYMLDDNRTGIEGLTLLDNTKTTSQMFADDTALFLQATLDNLNKTMAILTLFTKASGGKLNFSKSVAIHVGPIIREWTWPEDP